MALREELRGLVRGPGKRPPTTEEAAVVERLSIRDAVAVWGGGGVVVGSRKGWERLRAAEGVAGERLRGL